MRQHKCIYESIVHIGVIACKGIDRCVPLYDYIKYEAYDPSVQVALSQRSRLQGNVTFGSTKLVIITATEAREAMPTVRKTCKVTGSLHNVTGVEQREFPNTPEERRGN